MFSAGTSHPRSGHAGLDVSQSIPEAKVFHAALGDRLAVLCGLTHSAFIQRGFGTMRHHDRLAAGHLLRR